MYNLVLNEISKNRGAAINLNGPQNSKWQMVSNVIEMNLGSAVDQYNNWANSSSIEIIANKMRDNLGGINLWGWQPGWGNTGVFSAFFSVIGNEVTRSGSVSLNDIGLKLVVGSNSFTNAVASTN